MPLIVERKQVAEIYQQGRETGISLPAFCTEDQRTTEAILRGAYEKSIELGKPDLPITIAFTGKYTDRSQLSLYTSTGNTSLGLRALIDDVKILVSEDSPFKDLRVMLHFDHAIPWLDGDMVYDFVDELSSIMFDASKKPLDENIKMTAKYIEQVGDKVVVEGCVDEIIESGSGQDSNITTVTQAEGFVSRTGADLIVANLGTEHRVTGEQKKYHSDRAREISGSVGKMLVLHGTSCLKDEDLPKLTCDGIIKVNIFTILAVLGGQSVAEFVLKNLGNYFEQSEIEKLIQEGFLGPKFLEDDYIRNTCGDELKPKLKFTAEALRRDAWVSRVAEQVKFYLDVFGYAKL